MARLYYATMGLGCAFYGAYEIAGPNGIILVMGVVTVMIAIACQIRDQITKTNT